MIYLLFSALIVTFVHGYLLFTQRQDRKYSISTHAAATRSTYVIYLLGHIAAGTLFLLGMYQLLRVDLNEPNLFWVTVAGVSFEFAQAIVPAKCKTNKLHTILAYLMWLVLLVVGFLSLWFIPLKESVQIICLALFISSFVLGVIASVRRHIMYLFQMILITNYCVGMVILSWGRIIPYYNCADNFGSVVMRCVTVHDEPISCYGYYNLRGKTVKEGIDVTDTSARIVTCEYIESLNPVIFDKEGNYYEWKRL